MGSANQLGVELHRRSLECKVPLEGVDVDRILGNFDPPPPYVDTFTK